MRISAANTLNSRGRTIELPIRSSIGLTQENIDALATHRGLQLEYSPRRGLKFGVKVLRIPSENDLIVLVAPRSADENAYARSRMAHH